MYTLSSLRTAVGGFNKSALTPLLSGEVKHMTTVLCCISLWTGASGFLAYARRWGLVTERVCHRMSVILYSAFWMGCLLLMLHPDSSFFVKVSASLVPLSLQALLRVLWPFYAWTVAPFTLVAQLAWTVFTIVLAALLVIIEASIYVVPTTLICIIGARTSFELLKIAQGRLPQIRAMHHARRLFVLSRRLELVQADYDTHSTSSSVKRLPQNVEDLLLARVEKAWADLSMVDQAELRTLAQQWRIIGQSHSWQTKENLNAKTLRAVSPTLVALLVSRTNEHPPNIVIDSKLAETVDGITGIFVKYCLPHPLLLHLVRPFYLNFPPPFVYSFLKNTPFYDLWKQGNDMRLSRAEPGPWAQPVAPFSNALHNFLLVLQEVDKVDSGMEFLNACLRTVRTAQKVVEAQVELEKELLIAVLRWKERKNDLIEVKGEQRLK